MAIIDACFQVKYLVAIGLFSCIVYVGFRAYKKRDIRLENIMAVGLSTLSILGGLKLILGTFNSITDQNIATDVLMACYGGVAVIFIGVTGIKRKFKEP